MIRDSILSACLSSQQHGLFQKLAPGSWTQIQTPEHGPRQHTATGTFTIQNRGCIEIVCTNRLQTKLPVFVALIRSLQYFLVLLYCKSLRWYIVLWSSISKFVQPCISGTLIQARDSSSSAVRTWWKHLLKIFGLYIRISASEADESSITPSVWLAVSAHWGSKSASLSCHTSDATFFWWLGSFFRILCASLESKIR